MKSLNLEIKLLESKEDLDKLKVGDIVSLYTKYEGKTYYKNVGVEGSYTPIVSCYSGLAIYAGKGKVWWPSLKEKSKEVLKFISLKISPTNIDVYQVAEDKIEINEGGIIGNSSFLRENILIDAPSHSPTNQQQQYINLLRGLGL